MGAAHRLDADAERARYEAHHNDPSDPRYRAFLGRLLAPLVARLAAGAEGLDYGAGPGPTLSLMLAEAGFATSVYDPFFAPDRTVLDRSYDFITCTETAEHFYAPAEEFDRLDRLLRPGGWLAIMTEMRDDDRPFGSWWYVRDATHVCFYHPATMDCIAAKYGWHIERPYRTVTLFQKPD
jgi:SAM-dependent methyltransferase